MTTMMNSQLANQLGFLMRVSALLAMFFFSFPFFFLICGVSNKKYYRYINFIFFHLLVGAVFTSTHKINYILDNIS